MKKFLAFSLLLLSFSACKKLPADFQIKYGTSFGMCVGYCNNEIKVSTKEVVLNSTSRNETPAVKTCSRILTESEWNSLKNGFVVEKFMELKETYGCPDCADGGAEWVEITANGTTKKVMYEYNKAPEELKEQVAMLKEIMTSLNKCNP
jgi:hypothetical protein